MRYSVVCLLFFSSVIFANDNLINSYETLNKKMNECQAEAKRSITIENKYLSALSRQQQKVVLFVFAQKAKRECYLIEENDYALSVLNFAIETNNNQALNEFIALRKYDAINDEVMSVFESLDLTELKKIQELPELKKPFEPFLVTIK